MKTLIAEDDPTSRLLLQEFLKGYGRVIAVENGHEAVAAVEYAIDHGEPFDLILLDILMPEMNGHEALQHIRDSEHARGIASSDGAKIVMTTALGDYENVSSAYSGLCDGYLVKPIARAKLIEELKGLTLITE